MYNIFASIKCYNFLSLLQTGPNLSSKVDWGVNYRALNDLFHLSQSRKSSITYDVSVQMVEIYNEQVRDLLTGNNQQKKYPSPMHYEITIVLVYSYLPQFFCCLASYRHRSAILVFINLQHPRDLEFYSTKWFGST